MPKRYVVRLTDAEREMLNDLIKQRRVAAQKVLRAHVRSCTSSLRINLPGSLVDCHSGQKGLDERARMASQRLSHPW